MTTPQIKNLIGRASKNMRAASAARSYEKVRAILFKTIECEQDGTIENSHDWVFI